MNAILDAALGYAARGWPVLPLAAGTKRPAVRGGVHAATTDPDTIRRWWARWPDANIGIATGTPSRLVVLDIDGPAGARSLEQIEARTPLPATLTQTTHRGQHLVYELPDGLDLRCTTGQLGPGIDIRATGCYIAVAPSIHPDGTHYQWDNLDTPTADLPTTILDQLDTHPTTNETDPTPTDTTRWVDPEPTPELQAILDEYETTRDLTRAAHQTIAADIPLDTLLTHIAATELAEHANP